MSRVVVIAGVVSHVVIFILNPVRLVDLGLLVIMLHGDLSGGHGCQWMPLDGDERKRLRSRRRGSTKSVVDCRWRGTSACLSRNGDGQKYMPMGSLPLKGRRGQSKYRREGGKEVPKMRLNSGTRRGHLRFGRRVSTCSNT